MFFLYKSLYEPFYGKVLVSKDSFKNNLLKEFEKYKKAEKEFLDNICSMIELENNEKDFLLRLKIKSLTSINDINDYIKQKDEVLNIGLNIEIADSKDKLTNMSQVIIIDSEESELENPVDPVD